MSVIRSLPLVVGIMGDFAGKPEEVEPIAERSFILIDANNFDDSLARLRPRVAFSVPNTLTGNGNLRVDLRFTRFADFARAGIANQVDALKRLESAKVELLATMTWLRSLPSIGSHRVHARRGDTVGSMLRYFGAADREGEGNRTTIL